jgi:hypothetical protein
LATNLVERPSPQKTHAFLLAGFAAAMIIIALSDGKESEEAES